MKQRDPKKCAICGDMFIPKSYQQKYCKKDVVKKCVVCGDEFVVQCTANTVTCCRKPECRKMAPHMIFLEKRVCKACGEEFETTSKTMVYCKKEKTKICPSCGKEFTYICDQFIPETCGNSHCQAAFTVNKRRAGIANEVRICKWCGKEFHPREVMDVYCYDTHYKNCVICGKKFVFDPRTQNANESNTCSKECMGKLMSQNHDYEKGVETQRRNLMDKYGVANAMRIPGVIEKLKETNKEKYGAEWYTQTEEYKNKAKQTNLDRYGTEWYLGSKESMEKRTATNLEKYGVDNVFKSEEIKKKIKATNLERYGVECLAHNKEIRSKMSRNSKKVSSLELRICNLLDNYGIDYIHHYVVSQGECAHEFDFYLPEYKLLIDADGLYYHSYLDDPDGVRVREDYDARRMTLVPDDHRLYVIIEGEEDKQVKALVDQLESIACSLSNLDSIVFEWCRSIDFPYPHYDDKRMNNDFQKLQRYTNDKYIPQCRLGQSILKNFHKSIYHCKVGKSVSPYEGWYDDNKLKQVIRNRFIYKNVVDPSKVLAGFNISKICPCVSTFNPVLTKYLIIKYLNEYNSIFDPFSGFSGRLIGSAAVGKYYIGQDLNKTAVEESNQIIDFLKLDRKDYSVTCKDILESEGEYECLLTCPPYYKKEVYSNEVVFKSCDDWINECLRRFKCNKYVFVVDETYQFKDNIVEEIKSDSHLSKVSEYVIVIDQ